MPDAGRVIAGTARGIRLRPAGPATRPLADRVKQTLLRRPRGRDHGALADVLPRPLRRQWRRRHRGLSRGAPRAAFVERDRRALEAIRANLRRADSPPARWSWPAMPWSRSVATPSPEALANGRFGAALLDPPYRDGTLLAALDLLAEPDSAWLAEERWWSPSTSGATSRPSASGGWSGREKTLRRDDPHLLHRAAA